MPTIEYTASDFGRQLNGRHDLKVSWAEVLWAAITVGKWRDDLFIHGRYSVFEVTYRANLLWAYLQTDPHDRVVRTAAYNDLDATEKAGVSYALGMATTKLFASEVLGVPWLLHLDRYRTAFGIALRRGRSRPDLIGPRDPDKKMDWLVAEAKGRTHALETDAVRQMRSQKRRVLTIAGSTPFLYIGSAAHFTSGVLAVEVVDPPPRGRRREAFAEYDDDTKRRFARAYYAPLLSLLARAEPSDGGFAMRALPDADAEIGMEWARLIAIREYIAGERDDLELRTQQERAVSELPDRHVGLDGITVQLGALWSDESMRRGPRERVT